MDIPVRRRFFGARAANSEGLHRSRQCGSHFCVQCLRYDSPRSVSISLSSARPFARRYALKLMRRKSRTYLDVGGPVISTRSYNSDQSRLIYTQFSRQPMRCDRRTGLHTLPHYLQLNLIPLISGRPPFRPTQTPFFCILILLSLFVHCIYPCSDLVLQFVRSHSRVRIVSGRPLYYR
jgi:hypothetical protein